MLKSGKAYVKSTPDPAGRVPDSIKNHSEQKARVIPNENKTHFEEGLRLVPGKGITPEDTPPISTLTLESDIPKKIVPPSPKSDNKA